jgi:hypothetical protein
MGFLDNSTNNILIDAVLTDSGRRALALNNGSFSIVKFALGDDEVDYTIIKKYGTTVGKEKLIKNTPVMEAQTRGNLALRHKLLSLSSNTLLRLPSLSTTLEGNGTVLAMTISSDVSGNKKNVTVQQAITNQSAISPELVDGLFEVKLQNRFLFIPGQTPMVNTDNIATYLLNADKTPTSKGGSQLSFVVATRPINQFSVFATYANQNLIKTYIDIKGFFTGAQTLIEAQITNTTAS